MQAVQEAEQERRALGGAEQGGIVTGGHAGLALQEKAAAARYCGDERVQQRTPRISLVRAAAR